jgi:hypothetical protein
MARATVNYQVKDRQTGCSYSAWEDVDIEGTSELAVMEKLKKKEANAVARSDEITILKIEWQTN